jgi:hypothetical protein
VSLTRHEVRLGAPQRERAQRGVGEVERALGVAASPQRIEPQITPAAPT